MPCFTSPPSFLPTLVPLPFSFLPPPLETGDCSELWTMPVYLTTDGCQLELSADMKSEAYEHQHPAFSQAHFARRASQQEQMVSPGPAMFYPGTSPRTHSSPTLPLPLPEAAHKTYPPPTSSSLTCRRGPPRSCSDPGPSHVESKTRPLT